MVLSLLLSTNFVAPSMQSPSNEIFDRAGEQAAPANINPNPGLSPDTTGGQATPADTAK
jgi:hypothetical protein